MSNKGRLTSSRSGELRVISCRPIHRSPCELIRPTPVATSIIHFRVVDQRLWPGFPHDDAKRLKELENENARLKRLLAEAELDKSMLKELAEDAPIDQVGTTRAS